MTRLNKLTIRWLREEIVVTLNRSALVVKPKQPFLDWLHAVDPTSHRLTLPDLSREPTIYLIPECDTPTDVEDVLQELCDEIFCGQLAGWYTDTDTWPTDRSFEVFPPVVGLSTSFHAG